MASEKINALRKDVTLRNELSQWSCKLAIQITLSNIHLYAENAIKNFSL